MLTIDRQILVELTVQLVTSFFNEDKTTHENKNLAQGCLLAIWQRIFGQL